MVGFNNTRCIPRVWDGYDSSGRSFTCFSKSTLFVIHYGPAYQKTPNPRKPRSLQRRQTEPVLSLGSSTGFTAALAAEHNYFLKVSWRPPKPESKVHIEVFLIRGPFSAVCGLAMELLERGSSYINRCSPAVSSVHQRCVLHYHRSDHLITSG